MCVLSFLVFNTDVRDETRVLTPAWQVLYQLNLSPQLLGENKIKRRPETRLKLFENLFTGKGTHFFV